MKISVGKETLYGEKIQDVRRISERGDFVKGIGKAEVYEIMPVYMKHLKNSFPPLQWDKGSC